MKKFVLLILLSGLSLTVQATRPGRPGGSWSDTCHITQDNRPTQNYLDVTCKTNINNLKYNKLDLTDWTKDPSTTYRNCDGNLIKDTPGQSSC
jgi:hypothetical protein